MLRLSIMESSREAFLSLVRLGIGHSADALPTDFDWGAIQTLAERQGLLAVVVDGIECLPKEQRPPKALLLQWIGMVTQEEARYEEQRSASAKMALLFHENYMRTYVLKGTVIGECYPKPEHRVSSDMDCFLLPERSDIDAWSFGNDLIKAQGVDVSIGFYKNSTFHLPGLTVENHKFMTPFRGNKKLKLLEIMLQSMIKDDSLVDSSLEYRKIEGTWLYRPPVMVTALFLIEHAYSHFLHEGLTWRHVLDWMMFSKRHKKEIDWYSFDAMIEAFGFKKFYESYNKLGLYLCGDLAEEDLTSKDNRMLDNVWADLLLVESYHGIKAKVSFAFNTIRSWWKYRHFSEISMIHALWIQVYGFLFMKHPTLD